jgi:hypothetical protein
MHDFVRCDLTHRHPMHDLPHQHLDDAMHRREPGAGALDHSIRTRFEPRGQRARLHHQLADFGQYPSQHRAFFLSSLGEQMVFFDATQNRFHLFQSRFETLNTLFLQLYQGAATALRQPSEDARLVGIANR